MARRVLAFVLLLGGLVSAGGAGALPVLYGAAYSGPDGLATFYSVNPSTGAATSIGAIGFQRVSGMDFHPTTGVLYAVGERNDGSNVAVLLTINLATGAGTEVAALNGGAPHLFGDAYTDVSFRADGTLFAYLDPNDGVGTIVLGTGALTQLGSTGSGCCGNGIAFSPGGVLQHANESALHSLDQATGLATVLTALGYPVTDVFPRVNAMDYDPASGVLYASVRRDFANYLATIDPITGAVTAIGGSVNGLDALAVFTPAVPEPGTLALLAVVLGVLLRRQSSAA